MYLYNILSLFFYVLKNWKIKTRIICINYPPNLQMIHTLEIFPFQTTRSKRPQRRQCNSHVGQLSSNWIWNQYCEFVFWKSLSILFKSAFVIYSKIKPLWLLKSKRWYTAVYWCNTLIFWVSLKYTHNHTPTHTTTHQWK